jgi:hypothetical protein
MASTLREGHPEAVSPPLQGSATAPKWLRHFSASAPFEAKHPMDCSEFQTSWIHSHGHPPQTPDFKQYAGRKSTAPFSTAESSA